MHESQSSTLSPEAFADLKEIVLAEYGPTPDDEIHDIGIRLLNFFKHLGTEQSLVKPHMPHFDDGELTALHYIYDSVQNGSHPTVRGVAQTRRD